MNYSDQDLTSQDGTNTPDIDSLLLTTNAAKKLKEDRLMEIGLECKSGYEADKATSQTWREMAEEWIKMATQVYEAKDYPWPNASNIKYPLVATAAMQFSARAYPTLVPSDNKIVKPVVIGKDEDGEKLNKAKRATTYMNWQLLHDMDNWEEDMDRMLMMVAIMGTAFKKTFYDPHMEKLCSKLIDGRRIVINYFAESMERAERVSEDIYLYERQVDERKRAGIYLDVDLGEPSAASFPGVESLEDEVMPYFLVEQHTWLDLDNDGVMEPYVVTFHLDTARVLRIVPRYTSKGLRLNDKGKLVRIDPDEYYTKYGFIPNPQSRIYDLGFGHLLGPLNESVNTIINQLVDAGTLSNLQAGFIGKGLRLKMGDTILKPGEWRAVNATGDDLKKQILPLPTKEPSSTLFNLLGTLVTSGKELASVAEIFVGKMPGQNTPATTTMATIEQGMKVFTAIYKRIYRSLQKEFKKMFKLNNMFLDNKTYVAVLDDTIGPEDFDTNSYDVVPGADPTAVSSTERLLKAQGLMELLPTGLLDPVKVVMRILEAQEQPNWEELIPGLQETGQAQIPPKPDPKMLEMQMKMQADQMSADLKQRELAHKMAMDQRTKEFEMQVKAAEATQKLQFEAQKAAIEAKKAEHMQKVFMVDSAMKMQAKEQETNQNLRLNEATNAQKLRHQEEAAKSKRAANGSSSGKSTKSRSRSSAK